MSMAQPKVSTPLEGLQGNWKIKKILQKILQEKIGMHIFH